MGGVDEIYFAGRAFAKLLKDGTVVTRGNKNLEAALIGVKKVYSINSAVAAMMKDWTIVTWGDKD